MLENNFIEGFKDQNWQQEVRRAIKSSDALMSFLGIPIDNISKYPVFIPQDLAQRIKISGKDSPLWKQFVPHSSERSNIGLDDPIGDQKYQRPGQLIHRYSNRALFLPLTQCPVNCRYCFRKNELFTPRLELFRPNLDATVKYLLAHPEIEEIIFSGGDPLLLSDDKIKFFLEALSLVPHIKYIRFHTRTPVIIPKRLNPDFFNTLAKFTSHFKKILISIHANHISEFNLEIENRILKLGEIPNIELLSQSVLLKDINDSAPILSLLYKKFDELGIRPYYLHHPDKVKGAMHFYLSLEVGRKIYQQLRSMLPGWMIPHYMVDIPGGEGKTWAYNSEQYHFSGQFINQFGEPVPY